MSFQSKELLWWHKFHSEPHWSHTQVTVFLAEICSIFQPDMKFNPSKLIALLTFKISNQMFLFPLYHKNILKSLKLRIFFLEFIETKLQKGLIQYRFLTSDHLYLDVNYSTPIGCSKTSLIETPTKKRLWNTKLWLYQYYKSTSGGKILYYLFTSSL